MICATCGLYRCACATGRTTIKAGGASLAEAMESASGYLERRGWQGDLMKHRPVRTRNLGILGYQAWELTYEVRRR